MAKIAERKLWVIKAGIVPYDDGWHLQRNLRDARSGGLISDTLLLLQHPPVITFGRKANGTNLLTTEDALRRQGIDCVATDRGGDITYHGPGQLVVYPILALQDHECSVGKYVRLLEKVIIDCLAELGIEGRAVPGLIGVWVGERKIASIGVRVSKGVSTHGFAINVKNDLTPFQFIHPCGMQGMGMTSMIEHVQEGLDYGEVERLVAKHFQRRFQLKSCVVDTIGGYRGHTPGCSALSLVEAL